MINFYTNKLCWFEGHNIDTYGDTKEKIETSMDDLLDFPYYEYLGQTTDRGTRRTYKFSRIPRVYLGDKENSIYFEDSMYVLIKYFISE